MRAAWAVTTAAASFTWSDLGHRPDDPYYSTQTLVTYPSAATAIDVLNKIMVEELPAFFRMVPADELVLRPAPALTFCLAEKGHQYIVYSDEGAPFSLNTAATDGVAGAVAWALTSGGSSMPMAAASLRASSSSDESSSWRTTGRLGCWRDGCWRGGGCCGGGGGGCGWWFGASAVVAAPNLA